MSSVSIVSASDDKYLALFEEMLRSLGRKPADFDVNVIDLNLSDDAKTRIKAVKPDECFALAERNHDFSGRNKTPEYKKES